MSTFKRNDVAINVANALRRRRLEIEIENRQYRELLEQRVDARTAALLESIDRRGESEQALKHSREEPIKRLSLAIEFRSHETGEHVERIGVKVALR
jgi:response regulator RpfG family c-di-GMP phosphodiesterase